MALPYLRRFSFLPFLVLTTACSESTGLETAPGDASVTDAIEPTLTDGIASGSRLRAVFLESRAGTEVFQYFHDGLLDQDCSFIETTPGVYHCLPDGLNVAVPNEELVFADSRCSQPLAEISLSDPSTSPCAAPNFLVRKGTCAPTRVFRVTGAATKGSAYRMTGGACKSYTPNNVLYPVVSESLDTFAAGRRLVGQATEGVRLISVRSTDGALAPLHFQDEKEGFDCTLYGNGSEYRCLPRFSGLVGYRFADAECKKPAAMFAGCRTSRPEQLDFVSGAFEGENRYFRGGPRLAKSYQGNPTKCTASNPAEVDVYEVGEEIPFKRFVSGNRTMQTDADGLIFSFDRVGKAVLRNHELGTQSRGQCELRPGSDGQIRCMPHIRSSPLGLFADPECSRRVEMFNSNMFVETIPGTCPPRRRVFTPGDRHTGPVYELIDNICTLTSDSPPLDSDRTPHFALSGEIDPNEFVPLSRVVR